MKMLALSKLRIFLLDFEEMAHAASFLFNMRNQIRSDVLRCGDVTSVQANSAVNHHDTL